MRRWLEKLLTESMGKYPYNWTGDVSGGYAGKYCDLDESLLHAPVKKGDFVFRSPAEEAFAYEVTYANRETKRIRVRRTRLIIKYNDVLRNHKLCGKGGPDPAESKIYLEEMCRK